MSLLLPSLGIVLPTLTGQSDWPAWIHAVQRTAEDLKHWKYCDPYASPRTPAPACPEDPTTAEEVALYTFKDARFGKWETNELVSSCAALLQILHNRYAPSVQSVSVLLGQRYNKLYTLTLPRGDGPVEAVEEWANEWQNLFRDAARANHAFKDTLAGTFLELACGVHSLWHATHYDKLEGKSIDEIRTSLMTFMRRQNAHQAAIPAPVFAARDTPKPSSSSSEGKPKAKNWNDEFSTRQRCICGLRHLFAHCPYLNASVRPDGWAPDDDVAKMVVEKRSGRKAIDFALRWAKENPDICRQIKQKYTEKPSLLRSEQATVTEDDPVRIYCATNHKSNAVILDSGAHWHVCNDKSRFVEGSFDPNFKKSLLFGDGKTAHAEGKGMMRIVPDKLGEISDFFCADALYFPDAPSNLVSTIRILRSGVDISYRRMAAMQNERALWHFSVINDDFVIESATPARASVAANPMPAGQQRSSNPDAHASACDTHTWHRRLAHLPEDKIAALSKAVNGLAITSTPNTPYHTGRPPCEPCRLSKAKQIVSRVPQLRSAETLEKLHLDFHFLTKGLNGDECFLHVTDDATRMQFTYTLPKRQGALRSICENFLTLASTQWGKQVRIIRTDNDASISGAFRELLLSRGVLLETSAPHTPAQNGIAERSGGMLLQTARTMLVGSELPSYLWPEAVGAATYLLNRTRIACASGKTPYELLYGAKPAVSHIRLFGCRSYVLKKPAPPRTAKMEPRAFIGYLVGYDSTNVFRIWVPPSPGKHEPHGKVFRVRDATFNEHWQYNPGLEPQPIPEAAVVQIPLQTGYPLGQTATNNGQLVQTKDSAQPKALSLIFAAPKFTPEVPYLPQASPTPGTAESDISDEIVIPDIEPRSPTTEEDPTQQDEETEPSRPTQEINSAITAANIISGPRTRRAARIAIAAGSAETMAPKSAIPPPPTSFKAAQTHQFANEWREAMQAELSALQGANTFQPAHEPQAALDAIPTKWVYTYKLDNDGNIAKFKARLVVRGDMEFCPEDISTYAATPPASVVRLMAIYAHCLRLHTIQFDITTAFINAEIGNSAVYINTPSAWGTISTLPQPAPPALRLRRALYGLSRSPNLWFRLFSAVLVSFGFKEGETACIWSHPDSDIVLLHYVDDVRMVGPNDQALRKLLAAFEKRFKLCEKPTDLFLGLKFQATGDTLRMSQPRYIADKLATLKITPRARGCTTPLPADTKFLLPAASACKPRVKRMREKVGSLIWLSTISRPDIARAVSILSAVMHAPEPEHEELADHLWNYVASTQNAALTFTREQPRLTIQVKAFSDAAHGDNHESRTSAGYCFVLAGAVFDWKSMVLKTVLDNTTEAELQAANLAGRQLLYWQRVISSLPGMPGVLRIPLAIDNTQTLRILRQPDHAFHSRLHHINVKRDWLRQRVQEGLIDVSYVETNAQTADVLTKILAPAKHSAMLRLLGVNNSAC